MESKFKMEFNSNKRTFNIPDYDILLTMLSVLKWKQLNGSIVLYGDQVSIAQYDKLGILELWDDYNTDVFDSIDTTRINPTIFWSAGKFFAYLNEPAPCVALDTDMVVWQNLDKFYREVDVRFTHWESVEESYWYCKRNQLKRPGSYRFKRAWQWQNTLAQNTAILYFGNQEFKNYYAHEAIRYMTGNSLDVISPFAETPEILFVEQRLLPMCAKEKGIAISPFINAIWSPTHSYFTKHDEGIGEWIFFSLQKQPLFTHAWFYKRYIEGTPQARHDYCQDLVKVLIAEFPNHAHRLERIKSVKKYLQNI